jgi:hypothetical protein
MDETSVELTLRTGMCVLHFQGPSDPQEEETEGAESGDHAAGEEILIGDEQVYYF